MSNPSGRHRVQRWVALLLALFAVPAILSIDSAVRDAPITEGQPSPRTVVAPDLIQVMDPEATAAARDEAVDAVPPVLVPDEEAPAAIVRQVREAFATARSVREPKPGEPPLSVGQQVDALDERFSMLDEEGLRLLAGLSDDELDAVESETVGIVQVYAREPVREERVDDVADRILSIELAVRPLPDGVGDAIVEPIVRDAIRPTVREDPGATQAARQRAADAVSEVRRSYARGETIVREGEIVTEPQMEALRSRSLQGAVPWRTLLESFAIALVLTAVTGGYLRASRPQIWRSGRKLLVLTLLVTLSAAMLEIVALLPVEVRSTWSFAVPIGAVAMLIAILIDPPVAVLAVVPNATFASLALPGEPALVVFVVLASLGSVPLVSQLSARGDLRRAALWSTLGYALLAAVCAAVFGEPEQVPLAAAAGLAGGVLTAVVVNGSLPFLESSFGICTATSLLDLADRNHTLLRELEQKAIGTYNHSIVVSTMCERATRAIGANTLLAGVAALYHDIGKVRRPYFFVENQIGIANPHDELEPRVSAAIIHEHVTDGVAMAKVHRLPPEVIEGIATHHGTTVVSYFYRKAVAAAKPGELVEEELFRYNGPKPSSREMAVLMLADCCEGAARAAAQANRNLSREDLESIVHGLVAERVEDGQLEEASLTFRDLATVQRSFIDTLTGVYHPRITYPERPAVDAAAPASGPRLALDSPNPSGAAR